jgi:DNA-binding GntR family transcriptional regulator
MDVYQHQVTTLMDASLCRSPSVVTMSDDLDRDSPVPLYEQLAGLLRAEIDAGRIQTRLPSELTLTQRYGISRGTAHQAVTILVDAGYVRISHGKGTFILPEDQRRPPA